MTPLPVALEPAIEVTTSQGDDGVGAHLLLGSDLRNCFGLAKYVTPLAAAHLCAEDGGEPAAPNIIVAEAATGRCARLATVATARTMKKVKRKIRH